MGKPGRLKTCRRKTKTRRTETSKYPEEEKTISDSASSGERKRNSPNLTATVVGGSRTDGIVKIGSRMSLENSTIEGESPVHAKILMRLVS